MSRERLLPIGLLKLVIGVSCLNDYLIKIAGSSRNNKSYEVDLQVE